MTFTAWDLLVDAGFICALLIIGTLLRARFRLVQTMLLPASIIAGVLGLALGPNGAGVLPFSDNLGSYAGILNGVVFAALPLTGSFAFRGQLRAAKVMWSYSVSTYVLQWGLGLLITVAVLGQFFELPNGFGLLLAAGFVGGFGTAAAVGSTLGEAGWDEATSLGFTSATIGVLVGVVGGLILARWGVKKGLAGVAGSLADLPEHMRTGLVRNAKDRDPIGHGTVSESSLDPLTLHIALIAAITAAGYLGGLGLEMLFDVKVPLFATAFISGLIVRLVLDRMPARHYVDGTTMKSISGTATDLLVTVGIASIVPSIVVSFALPLALLLIFGVIYCVLMFRYLTPRMFSQRWLERGLFTWGWATGAVATGIALLKVVDPKSTSGTMEEFGLAYIGFSPVEIMMAIVAPFAIIAGLTGQFIAATLILGTGLVVLTFARRWHVSPSSEEVGAAQSG
ncbi:sodium/glutamate symporter [Arthrobacter sp. GCM10027362]|uniref:sodium/glutamate symporter n=1 Tax=Arthrobacter sp. GCM10027362 TaxID=3273379 RepID=UPI0036306964